MLPWLCWQSVLIRVCYCTSPDAPVPCSSLAQLHQACGRPGSTVQLNHSLTHLALAQRVTANDAPPAPPAAPPALVAGSQCGGRGNQCSSQGTCVDAAWPGRSCPAGTTCYRHNEFSWTCMAGSNAGTASSSGIGSISSTGTVTAGGVSTGGVVTGQSPSDESPTSGTTTMPSSVPLSVSSCLYLRKGMMALAGAAGTEPCPWLYLPWRPYSLVQHTIC
jgi:hypothetical protein